MSRPSVEYRDAARDALSDARELRRLWRLRMFQRATCLEEVRHIAEAIVRMTDEEVDRLRDHIHPGTGNGTGGYSYQHPPPAWMDGITRRLLGVPPTLTGPQA